MKYQHVHPGEAVQIHTDVRRYLATTIANPPQPAVAGDPLGDLPADLRVLPRAAGPPHQLHEQVGRGGQAAGEGSAVHTVQLALYFRDLLSNRGHFAIMPY